MMPFQVRDNVIGLGESSDQDDNQMNHGPVFCSVVHGDRFLVKARFLVLVEIRIVQTGLDVGTDVASLPVLVSVTM